MARDEFARMTPEERRENGRKGGIASGEARRHKKAMREALEVLLALPLKKGRAQDIDTIKSLEGLKGKNLTVQDAVLVAQIQRALRGHVQSAEYIRDTAGQSPGLNVSMEGDMTLNVSVDYGDQDDES